MKARPAQEPPCSLRWPLGKQGSEGRQRGEGRQGDSRSTQLSERSGSRNKVMIPHSPKLAHFFSSARPNSSRKSLSTASTDDLAKHPQPPRRV